MKNVNLETIGGRIKYLRKTKKMNQTEFGKVIKKKQSVIGSYENGIVVPPESVLVLICDKFNINEAWLIHGAGEMERDIDATLAAIAGDVAFEKDKYKKLFYMLGSEITEEEWEVIKKVMFKAMDLMDKIRAQESDKE